MTFGTPNITRLGASAVVLAVSPGSDAQAALWAVARAAKRWAGVREAVVADGSVTLLCDPVRLPCEEAELRLARAWRASGELANPSRTIEIPVRFGGTDGIDLAEIAERCALRESEVVEAHAGASYVVAFMGFAPGFAYLNGLPAALHLPRRAEPRTRVPAGSVAIAGAQSAVYPFDSPGGWHIIGRTEMRLFDPLREPFTALEPGDRVRFVPV